MSLKKTITITLLLWNTISSIDVVTNPRSDALAKEIAIEDSLGQKLTNFTLDLSNGISAGLEAKYTLIDKITKKINPNLPEEWRNSSTQIVTACIDEKLNFLDNINFPLPDLEVCGELIDYSDAWRKYVSLLSSAKKTSEKSKQNSSDRSSNDDLKGIDESLKKIEKIKTECNKYYSQLIDKTDINRKIKIDNFVIDCSCKTPRGKNKIKNIFNYCESPSENEQIEKEKKINEIINEFSTTTTSSDIVDGLLLSGNLTNVDKAQLEKINSDDQKIKNKIVQSAINNEKIKNRALGIIDFKSDSREDEILGNKTIIYLTLKKEPEDLKKEGKPLISNEVPDRKKKVYYYKLEMNISKYKKEYINSFSNAIKKTTDESSRLIKQQYTTNKIPKKEENKLKPFIYEYEYKQENKKIKKIHIDISARKQIELIIKQGNLAIESIRSNTKEGRIQIQSYENTIRKAIDLVKVIQREDYFEASKKIERENNLVNSTMLNELVTILKQTRLQNTKIIRK
jgi:hypothetical protein